MVLFKEKDISKTDVVFPGAKSDHVYYGPAAGPRQ